MNASVRPIILALLFTAFVIVLVYKQYAHARRLKLLVRKLYSTRLFDELAPLLRMAKRQPLEQITVDKTGIRIRLLYQAGSEFSFLMAERGYSYLSDERQEAMRVLLEQCVPKLADRKRYYVACRRERLINGDVEHSYSYTMKTAYKNKLVRAPYYDGSLKARLW